MKRMMFALCGITALILLLKAQPESAPEQMNDG